MLGRLGWSLARFVGLVFVLAGGWVFVVSLVEGLYPGWVQIWVLVASVLGASGGVLYLLSMDGPQQLHSRPIRAGGWLGMATLALLPSSVSLAMIPMLLLTVPTLFMQRGSRTPQGVAG